jgi:hypothetical protein
LQPALLQVWFETSFRLLWVDLPSWRCGNFLSSSCSCL